MGRSERKKDSFDAGARWQWPSSGGDVPGLPAFKTACYEIARRTGGRVEAVSAGLYVSTFDDVVLAYRNRKVAVLCHRWLPLLALVDAPVDSPRRWPMSFIDDPSIGPPLATMLQVRLLTAAELTMDWSRAAGCPPTEVAARRDIEYWRPESVGDVIFNIWD